MIINRSKQQKLIEQYKSTNELKKFILASKKVQNDFNNLKMNEEILKELKGGKNLR